jgi:hypothetical protein
MGALGMKETEQEEEGTYEHGLEDEQNDEHVVASYWQRMLPNLLPSLSILQPPVSVAVFLLLLLAFPWIRFSLWDLLLLLLLLSLSLSLSLSLCKNQSGGERKKKICITTHIKALAPMKKDSYSSSSPWVLSAKLQNLSANQTWNNNICSNHGM